MRSEKKKLIIFVPKLFINNIQFPVNEMLLGFTETVLVLYLMLSITVNNENEQATGRCFAGKLL